MKCRDAEFLERRPIDFRVRAPKCVGQAGGVPAQARGYGGRLFPGVEPAEFVFGNRGDGQQNIDLIQHPAQNLFRSAFGNPSIDEKLLTAGAGGTIVGPRRSSRNDVNVDFDFRSRMKSAGRGFQARFFRGGALSAAAAFFILAFSRSMRRRKSLSKGSETRTARVSPSSEIRRASAKFRVLCS